MLLLRLFYEFAKIGLFAIGGGMATIPFLTKLASTTGWFTETDLLNMIAVSESTPGPIGVNTATYVGYHIAGFQGALIATLGLITPSVIVILIIFQFLKKFGDSKYVKAVMYGLRAASARPDCRGRFPGSQGHPVPSGSLGHRKRYGPV